MTYVEFETGLAGRGALSLVRREKMVSAVAGYLFRRCTRPDGGFSWGSGEGKSLLLQCLLDLLPENLRLHGAITLDGKMLNSQDIRECRGNTFSYVPQGVQALNPLLSIEKHLRRASQLSGQTRNAGKIEKLLQRSQLETSVLDAFPRQLSGGMAKRVLACHASLSQARYILADEITARLDAPLANQLLEQLRGLCEQGLVFYG